MFKRLCFHSCGDVLIGLVHVAEDLVHLDLGHGSVLVKHQGYSHLKASPVEGDVGDPLDGAIVQNVRDQEQTSYLFNSWGLKQGSEVRQ